MSKITLKQKAAANFPDNLVKYISPALARDFFNELIDEVQLEVSGGDPIRYTRSFSLSNPLMDGGSFNILTTLPEGSRLDGISFIGSGLTDGIVLRVFIGSVADENLYLESDTTSANSISNFPNSISLATAAADAVVIIQGSGGNIISGSLSIKILIY